MKIGETYYVPIDTDGRVREGGAGDYATAQRYISDFPLVRDGFRIARVRLVEVPEEPRRSIHACPECGFGPFHLSWCSRRDLPDEPPPNAEQQQDQAIQGLAAQLVELFRKQLEAGQVVTHVSKTSHAHAHQLGEIERRVAAIEASKPRIPGHTEEGDQAMSQQWVGNSITLIGAEDVRVAGHQMATAAESIRHAVGSLDDTLMHHRQWMGDWLMRFEAALKEAKP